MISRSLVLTMASDNKASYNWTTSNWKAFQLFQTSPSLGSPTQSGRAKGTAGTPASPISHSFTWLCLATESPRGQMQRSQMTAPPQEIQTLEMIYVHFVTRWNTINKLGTCPTGKHHVLVHFLFWSKPKANYNKWPINRPNSICGRHCSGKRGNLVLNR